jgi:hypothetical protein
MIFNISLEQSNHLKTIAILMMLFLHLFNRDYEGLFIPLIFVGDQPLSYYISLFCDACVPIFAFASGYGLYYKYKNSPKTYKTDNFKRLKKLYLNYWIILLLFAVGVGFLLGSNDIPGSWSKFILNLTAVHPSYNGAWWFFTTYVFFVLSCSFWFRLLDKFNPYIYLGVLVVLYFISFYFRIYKPAAYSNVLLNWTQSQVVLYFCTLFQFMLGAFFYKYNWGHVIKNIVSNKKISLFYFVLCTAGLIIIHGVIPNFVVAPFTALSFIFLFLQLQLNKRVSAVLDFFTPHATNMWLVHMFFYMIFFKEFIYSPKYVLPIFSLLILCSVISSFVINRIYNSIIKIVNL